MKLGTCILVALLSVSCVRTQTEEKGVSVSSPKPALEKFDFSLKSKKSLSGRWYLINGQPASKVRLKVYYGEDKKYLKSVLTDQYGNYVLNVTMPKSDDLLYIESDYIGTQNGQWMRI